MVEYLSDILRYNKELQIIWKLDSEASEHLISRMLIQPLLENSISHGLRFKEEPCKIVVKVCMNH